MTHEQPPAAVDLDEIERAAERLETEARIHVATEGEHRFATDILLVAQAIPGLLKLAREAAELKAMKAWEPLSTSQPPRIPRSRSLEPRIVESVVTYGAYEDPIY